MNMNNTDNTIAIPKVWIARTGWQNSLPIFVGLSSDLGIRGKIDRAKKWGRVTFLYATEVPKGLRMEPGMAMTGPGCDHLRSGRNSMG